MHEQPPRRATALGYLSSASVALVPSFLASQQLHPVPTHQIRRTFGVCQQIALVPKRSSARNLLARLHINTYPCLVLPGLDALCRDIHTGYTLFQSTPGYTLGIYTVVV